MSNTIMPLHVGAVLFPYFELLDLYGPLEMFGLLAPSVQITCVAAQAGRVKSAQGVSGYADLALHDAPPFDVLVLPGGIGTLPALDDENLIAFLRSQAKQCKALLSVCTGSALLAKAGLLDGRRATSNKQYFALAQEQSSAVNWVPEARWVADGIFFTSSGVSAGTDAALAVIARLFGRPIAERVCMHAEYTWHQDADQDPFSAQLNHGDLARMKVLANSLIAS